MTQSTEIERAHKAAEKSLDKKLHQYLCERFSEKEGYCLCEEFIKNISWFLSDAVTTIYFIQQTDEQYSPENIKWVDRVEHYLSESLKGIKHIEKRAQDYIDLHRASIKPYSPMYGSSLYKEYIPDWTPADQGKLDCLTNNIISDCSVICEEELMVLYSEELSNGVNTILY